MKLRHRVHVLEHDFLRQKPLRKPTHILGSRVSKEGQKPRMRTGLFSTNLRGGTERAGVGGLKTLLIGAGDVGASR